MIKIASCLSSSSYSSPSFPSLLSLLIFYSCSCFPPRSQTLVGALRIYRCIIHNRKRTAQTYIVFNVDRYLSNRLQNQRPDSLYIIYNVYINIILKIVFTSNVFQPTHAQAKSSVSIQLRICILSFQFNQGRCLAALIAIVIGWSWLRFDSLHTITSSLPQLLSMLYLLCSINGSSFVLPYITRPQLPNQLHFQPPLLHLPSLHPVVLLLLTFFLVSLLSLFLFRSPSLFSRSFSHTHTRSL